MLLLYVLLTVQWYYYVNLEHCSGEALNLQNHIIHIIFLSKFLLYSNTMQTVMYRIYFHSSYKIIHVSFANVAG